MNMKLQGSLFLVFQLYFCIITAQFIVISRPRNGVDSFNLPSWMCGNPQYSCNSFNAVGQLPSCSCVCSIPMATFTFVNNRWTCMVNQQARDHIQQGCDTKSSLIGESADKRLPTMNLGDVRQMSMNYYLWQYWTCVLKHGSSSYITCDGTRRNFTQRYSNIFPRLFTMTRTSQNAPYFLRANTGVTGSNLLQGKILNLFVDCSVPLPAERVHVGVCVTLKLQGTESCPIQAPSSSVPSSTLLTKTTLITKSSLKPYTSNIQQSSSNLLPLASSWKSRASSVVSSSKPSALHTTVPTSSEWTSMVNSSPRAQSSGVLSTRTIKASKSSTTIIVPSSPIGLATFSRSVSTSRRSDASWKSPTISDNSQTRSSSRISTVRTKASDSSPKISRFKSRTSSTLSTISNSLSNASTTSSINSSPVAVVKVSQTGFQILPTINIPPVAVEVSPSVAEGHETQVLLSPVGPIKEPATSEPKIPPNVGSGRKGQGNGVYIGISTAITAFIIATVIIMGFLIYRRNRSRMLPRSRSASQETKISVVSPHAISATEEEDTIKRSPMYVPDYGIPLWDDEVENGPIYAVIQFPDSKEAVDDDGEPFYYFVEEAVRIDNEGSGAPIKFDENHIYAKVKRRKDYSPDMSDLINSKENSGCSDDSTEALLEVLGPYVGGPNATELLEYAPEKSVYLTLEECFSDTLRRCSNDLECEDGPIFGIVDGPDQHQAICSEELMYYTINESEVDEQNNNTWKSTTGKMLHELQEGERPTTKNPGLVPEESCLDGKAKNEPLCNFFEEICPTGTPSFSRRTIRDKDGPIYFHLRRLKSNHSKATRIQPKWRNEDCTTEGDKKSGAGGDENSNPIYARAPVFYKLKTSGSEEQNNSNSTVTIEQAFNQLEDRYLKNPEEAGKNSRETQGLICDSREQGNPGANISLGGKEPTAFKTLALSNHDGPMYFHLRRLKSNHSKATRISARLEDEAPSCDEEKQTDSDDGHYENISIYKRAPVLYALNRSDAKEKNNRDTMFTIEQAFDQLEDHYFQKQEESRDNPPERPSGPLKTGCLRRDQTKDSSAANKSVQNPLEEVSKRLSKFRSLSNHDGPVYFHLRRFKSNHSKATRISPRLEAEPECSVDKNCEGADKAREKDPIYERAPVFYNLKTNGSDKQNKENSMVTIEEAFDKLEDRYLKNPEVSKNSLDRRGLIHQTCSLDETTANDSTGTERLESSFLEMLSNSGAPAFKTLSNHDGPVYFHMRRLKSNYSKATRIPSRLDNEAESGAQEEENDTEEGHYEKIPIYTRAPAFYSLKRPEPGEKNNTEAVYTIEQAFDKMEGRYLKKHEQPETTPSKMTSREQTNDSFANNEVVQNVLEEVQGKGPSKFRSLSDHDGPIYFHLRRFKSNHSKATRIRPRLEGESESSVASNEKGKGSDEDKEKDQIYARAPVFYNLKRSGSDKQTNNNTMFTIEQAFDQLEDRYLKGLEQAESTSPKGPVVMLKSRCLERRNVKGSGFPSEPADNSLFKEDPAGNGVPAFPPLSNHDGPVYFHLRRLKSNHSKVSRIQPPGEDEPAYSAIGEKYLKGAEGVEPSEKEPIYVSLEELCSENFKRDINDDQGSDELDDDIVLAQYLERTEGADCLERPVFFTLETFCSMTLENKKWSEAKC